MAWLWGSSGADGNDDKQAAHKQAADSHVEPKPETRPKQELDRHQQAFADLKELLSQVDPERSERASAAVQERAARQPENEGESLYASEMSCSQCFDLAYYCSSVGGQLNNVYRFGGLRSCTEQWAKWRFCMRTRAMSSDLRKERIQEWNREQAARYRVGRSSEDVWEVREEPVEGAFERSVDEFEY